MIKTFALASLQAYIAMAEISQEIVTVDKVVAECQQYFDEDLNEWKCKDDEAELEEKLVRITKEDCDQLEYKEWNSWDEECMDGWIYQMTSEEDYKNYKDCENDPFKKWI